MVPSKASAAMETVSVRMRDQPDVGGITGQGLKYLALNIPIPGICRPSGDGDVCQIRSLDRAGRLGIRLIDLVEGLPEKEPGVFRPFPLNDHIDGNQPLQGPLRIQFERSAEAPSFLIVKWR